ncbi:hypothetical protein EVAR_19955_1 [Eumeta japonica]|uniref:Histone-lysine N-methyltransferase SETMAR n=1 Tax=Eumeta variegata TaxID=151549 RepID=A0A4C1YGL9_EUMVA|nr:hypothetical protein EVAR_19955_1 [Eumeta japonica]
MRQKLFIMSTHMMNLRSMRTTPKLNKSQRWVFQDEPNPTKVIRAKSTLKQMVAYFFGMNGHGVSVPLENRKTVNTECCYPSAETTRFLEGQKIGLTGYPLYSPDLIPSDFYLFPSVKNTLRGQRFWSREEATDAFKIHVLEIPQSEWKKC